MASQGAQASAGDVRPIGVFDSGIGGLTVLKALMARLPHESTLYLGDTARLPYGTKSAEVVTRYTVHNADFLIERGIKLLVVACNTASAVALPRLAAHVKVPVIGVIEPGARAAAAKTKTGRVGVIGTLGTIGSGAYTRALQEAKPGVQVFGKACPLFVPLAEEGWTQGEVPRLVAQEYLSALSKEQVDALVLGCTHYPLLKAVIGEVMGPDVALVDSAEATADAVARRLSSEGLLTTATGESDHQYFVTDVADKFLAVAERFLGRPVKTAEQVDVPFR